MKVINLKFVLPLLVLTSVGCLGSSVKKDITLHDGATLVKTSEYQILGKGTGEDSAFFLLGMFPVTNPPNTELALSQIMEKFPNGKTLINIKVQREDRAYFPLGLVSVVRVTADVIGDPAEVKEPEIRRK
ncbi:MAG: hypothetical protein O9301_06015 [Leptospira sp.]|nr:hypothetical protein [Leptospira sp.]